MIQVNIISETQIEVLVKKRLPKLDLEKPKVCRINIFEGKDVLYITTNQEQVKTKTKTELEISYDTLTTEIF